MSGISENGIKRTQEQATASWIGYLYSIRMQRVKEAFSKQDFNLAEAMNELNDLKLFVANVNHILGNPSTKHGEVAEHCQVNIANARSLVRGLVPEYSFDNVGRTAPEDYFKNGLFKQLKFYNGEKGTLKAIEKHFNTYPDFLKNGGSYDIPRDQYDRLKRLKNFYESEQRSLLSKEDMSIVRALLKMQEKTGIDFDKDIHRSIVGYKEVQLNVVNKTIEQEEHSILETDSKQREDIYHAHKPNNKEMLDISTKAALFEGGISFAMAYIRKRKEGKTIDQFSSDDWKDLGIEFGKGSIKGSIRGGSVYLLTNYTATPACVASAYATAAFGICESLSQYRDGKIDFDSFIVNSETLSMEVSISALSSLAGQMLIPVPVLGSIIGSISGELIYGICKEICNKQEMQIIQMHREHLRKAREQYEEDYSEYIKVLNENLSMFKTIEELAFDEDVNMACINSIKLAQSVGVSEEKILKSEEDLERFLLD